MSESKIILVLLFFLFSFGSLANSQEIEEITIGTKMQINVEPNKNMLYNFIEKNLKEKNFTISL